MQTPRLRPKNLKKKKKGGAPANSPTPKPRPRNLATKKEKDALDSGFRIQEMEGREREGVKNMKSGGKLKMVKKGGKSVPFYAADGVGKMAYGGKVKKMAYGGKAKVKKMNMGGKCRGMGKATQGGKYSKMG